MKIRTRAAAAAPAVLLLAGLGLAVSPAAADPNNANSFPLDLTCSNGQEYAVTVMATTGDQPAVHVVDSTSVLVPTNFRFHLRITADADGTVLDESDTPPETVHGRSGDRLDTFECTFAQFAHHVWPDVGAVTIEVDGTVQGYLPH